MGSVKRLQLLLDRNRATAYNESLVTDCYTNREFWEVSLVRAEYDRLEIAASACLLFGLSFSNKNCKTAI